MVLIIFDTKTCVFDNNHLYTYSFTLYMYVYTAFGKVLPNRDFLQILRVPQTDPLRGKSHNIVHDDDNDSNGISEEQSQPLYQLEHDLEWLTIISHTHHLLQDTSSVVNMPSEMQRITAEVSG